MDRSLLVGGLALIVILLVASLALVAILLVALVVKE